MQRTKENRYFNMTSKTCLSGKSGYAAVLSKSENV
jgi:hypothetical protein